MVKRTREAEREYDNRIVELMKERGISYRQLEQLSGVQYPTIYKVATRNFNGARVETVKAIAHGLGVGLLDLFLPEDIEQ